MSALVVEVNNPFNPQQDLKKYEIASGSTVINWLEERFPDFFEFQHPTICLLNGTPLLRKEWQYTIQDKDIVSFVRLAPGDPVSIGVTILVSLAVSAAVSYFLQPNVPKPNSGNIPASDPVYSLKGQSNAVKLMEPIESAYGRVRMWPSHAARSYNKFHNNDQIAYSLFCLGQGAVKVEKIQLEDTDIESYQDIETEITPPGELVSLFPDNIVTSVEVSRIELTKPTRSSSRGTETYTYTDNDGDKKTRTRDYIIYTDEPVLFGPYSLNPANTLCNRIEVDLVLPQGLYYSNDNGGLDARSVSAAFEYRKIDDQGNAIGEWQPLLEFSKSLATQNTRRYTLGADVAAGRYEVRGWRVNYSNFVSGKKYYLDNRGRPFYYTGSHLFGGDKIYPDASNRLVDKLYWESARAFLPSQKDFGDVSMLAFKARATNNVNNNASNRVNVIGTRKLPKWHPETGWSEPVATRSIVWAFCDVFRAAYGGKLADQHLDLATLYKMDLEYEERGEYFDWIFDQKSTVWDAATTIARCGRAVPILNGSQITMIRDESKSFPVAVFNQENIVENSFKWDIQLFEDNQHDSVEVEYTDPDTWNPEEVLCVLPESDGINPEKVKLAGCTNRDQAYREGMYIAASNYYLRENVSFQTGLEGHIPTYGDLISVSHDLPRWGQAGFVQSINGLIVELSDPVTFGDGNNYIVFRRKDGSAAGPYQVVETEIDYVVKLLHELDDEFYFDDIHEPPLYQFGLADKWAKLCKVVEIQPSGSDVIDISCTNYDIRPYSYENLNAPPLEDRGNTPPKIPDLPIVNDLEAIALPSSTTFVNVTWNAALGAKSYILQQSLDGEDWDTVETLTTNNYVLPITKGHLYLRVCGVNVGAGPWNYWDGEVGNVVVDPVDPDGGDDIPDDTSDETVT